MRLSVDGFLNANEPNGGGEGDVAGEEIAASEPGVLYCLCSISEWRGFIASRVALWV